MVSLDGHGKLLAFTGKPYNGNAALPEPISPDVVFRTAGFDRTTFQETAATMLPQYASDQVLA